MGTVAACSHTVSASLVFRQLVIVSQVACHVARGQLLRPESLLMVPAPPGPCLHVLTCAVGPDETRRSVVQSRECAPLCGGSVRCSPPVHVSETLLSVRRVSSSVKGHSWPTTRWSVDDPWSTWSAAACSVQTVLYQLSHFRSIIVRLFAELSLSRVTLVSMYVLIDCGKSREARLLLLLYSVRPRRTRAGAWIRGRATSVQSSTTAGLPA
jgi:hypothetical protein